MNTRVITLPQYKHLFFALALIALVSAGLYVYGINMTVRNIVARQTIETQLATISLETGEQEFSYIAASNSIDLAKAEALGFSPVDDQSFVSRTPKVAYAVSVAHN